MRKKKRDFFDVMPIELRRALEARKGGGTVESATIAILMDALKVVIPNN